MDLLVYKYVYGTAPLSLNSLEFQLSVQYGDLDNAVCCYHYLIEILG